jgi:hypothetical protein
VSDIDPVAQTKIWVEQFVVGLNLCPFAAAPVQRDGVRYVLSPAGPDAEGLAQLLHECALLTAPEGPETTLFIYADQHPAFSTFLDHCGLAEALLEHHGFGATLQCVSFHPAYCFEGVDATDPANATNQSPYPMIHLLKRADVAEAIASHPDTAQIPRDNVARLRGLSAPD